MICIRSLSKLVLHWSWNTHFDLFQNLSLFIQVRERIASNLISGNNRAKSKIYKLTASGMHFTLSTPPFLRKSTTSRHGQEECNHLKITTENNGENLVIFASQWWSAKKGISRIWRVTTHHTEIVGKTFWCLPWNAEKSKYRHMNIREIANILCISKKYQVLWKMEGSSNRAERVEMDNGKGREGGGCVGAVRDLNNLTLLLSPHESKFMSPRQCHSEVYSAQRSTFHFLFAI